VNALMRWYSSFGRLVIVCDTASELVQQIHQIATVIDSNDSVYGVPERLIISCPGGLCGLLFTPARRFLLEAKPGFVICLVGRRYSMLCHKPMHDHA
jgi:hypothetical protein